MRQKFWFLNAMTFCSISTSIPHQLTTTTQTQNVCRLYQFLLRMCFLYYWIPMYVGVAKYLQCEYFAYMCWHEGQPQAWIFCTIPSYPQGVWFFVCSLYFTVFQSTMKLIRWEHIAVAVNLRRNVTIVHGHLTTYLDLKSLEIRRSGLDFKSNLTSAIGDLANRDI